jgi:hypothetical protein
MAYGKIARKGCTRVVDSMSSLATIEDIGKPLRLLFPQLSDIEKRFFFNEKCLRIIDFLFLPFRFPHS